MHEQGSGRCHHLKVAHTRRSTIVLLLYLQLPNPSQDVLHGSRHDAPHHSGAGPGHGVRLAAARLPVAEKTHLFGSVRFGSAHATATATATPPTWVVGCAQQSTASADSSNGQTNPTNNDSKISAVIDIMGLKHRGGNNQPAQPAGLRALSRLKTDPRPRLRRWRRLRARKQTHSRQIPHGATNTFRG